MSEARGVAVRVVEAGRGAAWWSRGFRIFTAAPWPWMGVMLVYMILSAIMSAIPYVGDLGQWLLTPVFMGGLMLGCRALERGEKLRFEHLFEGFQKERFVPLLVIGAVNIGLALAIFAVAATGVFGFLSLASLMQAGSDPVVVLERALADIPATGIVGVLVVLAILTVFAMLNWFAPALVALHEVPAVEAMKLSFVSCLRNWLPFLVYGAIGIAILVACGIAAVVAFAAVFAAGAGAIVTESLTAGLGALVGLVLLLLALVALVGLVVGPIVFGTTYAGYKDTLAPQDPDPAQPAFR